MTLATRSIIKYLLANSHRILIDEEPQTFLIVTSRLLSLDTNQKRSNNPRLATRTLMIEKNTKLSDEQILFNRVTIKMPKNK